MSNCREIREMIIDSVYEEGGGKVITEHIEICHECREYYEEIKSVLKRMEITEPQIPAPLADIENVIKKAEDIQSRKRMRLENLAFILSCVCLLCAVLLTSIRFGSALVLFVQILLYLNLPFVLIPLIAKRGLKEGIR